jgi:hypothetical protein
MPVFKTYHCVECGELQENVPNTMGLYCSATCQHLHARKKKISSWVSGETAKIHRRLVKMWLTEEKGYCCNVCGISEWQGKPLTLWVDHIDGDATNNRPENFQLVCPNCDSQQPTFGAKNYGNGRKSRGLKPYD